jgi:hypothetical protein
MEKAALWEDSRFVLLYKSRKMRWRGHVAGAGEKINQQKILEGNAKEKTLL